MLTLVEVKATLYTWELCQKAIGDNGDCGSGLVVISVKILKKTGSNSSNGARSGTRNITCYYCKELGHFRSSCSELKNKCQATIVETK